MTQILSLRGAPPLGADAPPRPPRVLAVEYSRWQSPLGQLGIAPLRLRPKAGEVSQ
jgi:hypothetical protein